MDIQWSVIPMQNGLLPSMTEKGNISLHNVLMPSKSDELMALN